MKESNFKIMMLTIFGIFLSLVVGWIFTPTDFNIDLSMDNNSVLVSENMARVGQDTEIIEKIIYKDITDSEELKYYGTFGLDCGDMDLRFRLINITDDFGYEIIWEDTIVEGEFLRSK